jgi:signal transduction histidine kinase
VNLISFLDLLGVLFLFFALWTIFHKEVRQEKIFQPLMLLIVLFALNLIPNFIEWMGYEALVEPFEEYVQILIPAAFFVVFTFVKFEESENILSSRNRVLMAIHTITEKLQVGLKPEELWTDFLGRVINVMGFEGGFIHSPEDHRLVNIRMRWEGWEQFSAQLDLLNIEDTILSEVFMTRKPMVVQQTHNMPDSFIQALNMSGVVSVALFPVSSDAKMLGVMGIVSLDVYTFTEEELDLFTMLGHHFGEIIHNSILVDGARDQADDLRRALDGRRHFLTLISDDLREPLLRIRTVLQRLSDEISLTNDPDLKMVLAEADNDSKMLERLIDDVRELAVLDSGSYDLAIIPQDLMKELRRIKEQFQVKAEDKGVSLTLRYNNSLSPVEADHGLVSSAIRHLLSNAIEYTPENGQVSVDAWEEGGVTCIQIADTGIGIKEEDSEKVFDMFYRTSLARDKERVGTGLGLTIVSRIVKLHMGEISFRPGTEAGTVFTIKLPRIHLEEV